MEPDFWLQRWIRNETGFHQSDPNRILTAHWSSLRLAPRGRVFVPLCGKSVDLLWLRERGHEVIGVELSPLAATAFAHENGLAMQRDDAGPFVRHRIDGLTLLVGDFFDLTVSLLGDVQAVYDRAALVALPGERRRRYARHMERLLPAGAQTLLATFDYDQRQMDGPPFAVDDVAVRALYDAAFTVELLAQTDILAQEPKFRERGLTWLSESAYRLVRR